MTDQSIKDLSTIAKEYSNILSTPFLPTPRIDYIKNKLKSLPYKIEENPHSLIIRVKGKSSRKLVLMSHLDHPGIVVKNRSEGLCLGSLFPDRLIKIISNKGYIFLDIYHPDGKFLTKGKLIGLEGRYHQKAILDIPVDVPKNSSAYYQIDRYKEDKDFLYLYAADNDVPTICLLNLLQNIKSKPFFTLIFTFTFFEEVHQVSSFALASQNVLELNSEDLVLNLECKKIENNPLNPPENTLDYDSGAVLQPSEKDCLYGYHFKSPNLLEKLVLNLCWQNKITFQYGLGLGSTDARPFSNFRLTPNICTLDVPNRFKHNCDDRGRVVLEKIKKKDVYSMYRIIDALTQLTQKQFTTAISSKKHLLSRKFKENDSVTSSGAMKNKILLNYRLDLANKAKIITKEYYPSAPLYRLLDLALNSLSYPYYYLLRILKLT